MPDETTAPMLAEARVRRVPKYGVFLTLGGALGVIAAMVLTFAFDGSSEKSAVGVLYSQGQVFGFLLLFCIAGGVALGAVVALVLDRTVGRKTHAVTIERETVVTAND